MNYSAQKAALTRAINSGSHERVVAAAIRATAEWDEAGGYWPDDWSRWQRALDDSTGLVPAREEGFIPEYCDAVLASIERQERRP